MELSKTEIQKLFDFVRSKYVRHIDVQYEIVDHLATAIENERHTYAQLDFDTALNRVYSRFPITGFAYFVQQKERALETFWKERIFRYLAEYFTWPKILLTILLSYISYYLIIAYERLFLSGNYKFLIVVLLCSIIIGIFQEVYRRKTGYRKDKYLSIQSFNTIQGYIGGAVCFLIPFCNSNFVFYTQWTHIFCSFILALYSVYLYGCIFVFPKKIKAEINELHKHLALV